jgi:hypothetical protein
VVLALGGAAVLLVGVVWAGAALALLVAGDPVAVSVGAAADALAGLVGHLGDPAAAWSGPASERLPGPVVYWACTAIAGAALAAVVRVAVRLPCDAIRLSCHRWRSLW